VEEKLGEQESLELEAVRVTCGKCGEVGRYSDRVGHFNVTCKAM
jgi:hypothetical protein